MNSFATLALSVMIVASSTISCAFGNASQRMEGGFRCINCKPAKPFHRPFQVALDDGNCGGSLIRMDWVLTAAHCVTTVFSGFKDKLEEIKVSGGRVGLEDDGMQHRYAMSWDIFVHKYWNARELRKGYDLALIRLEQPFRSDGGNVSPIGLNSIHRNEDLVNRRVTISGWGMTEKSNEGSPILLQTDLRIQDRTDQTLELSHETGSSPCKGDSGGPATLSHPRLLVGVASYIWPAAHCGEGYNDGQGTFTNYTSHYVSVQANIEWIQDIIQ